MLFVVFSISTTVYIACVIYILSIISPFSSFLIFVLFRIYLIIYTFPLISIIESFM